ncbi:MAG: AAA family ATPase [Deltaproteobacteria bacterium]|nr:AAA family ATPase [Deltaproteobacteria bacterium]
MYTEFFGLTEKPFELTPSPRFLYMSESHREALALLTYGVTEQKGFVLLTGEVGTGKTTMVHTLLSNLNNDITHVFLSNPILTSEDLLKYVASSAFGKKVQFKSKAEFLLAFEELLQQNRQHQRKFLLIIDEAQRLSFELLEEIRLFSNLETDDGKLLNIFLIGQPELNDILNDPRCRPLLQRISIRHHLSPLSLAETREYASTRLKVAGARDPENFFHESVIRALHEYSAGYPRLINILADNALLLAYSRGKKKVTSAMIKECHEEMQIDSAPPVPIPAPERKQTETTLNRGKWRWKWLYVLLLLLILAGFALSPRGRADLSKIVNTLKTKSRILLESDRTAPGESPKEEISNSPLPAPDAVLIQPGEQKASASEPILPSADSQKNRRLALEGTASRQEPQNSPIASESQATKQADHGPSLSGIMAREEKPSFNEVTVKRGDTVTHLALNIYGYVDDALIEMIQRHNSHIRDINRISVGQKIMFPSISSTYQSATYAVHIASYENFQNAQTLFQKLISEGTEAYIVPAYSAENSKVYRVAAGSFTNSEEADRFAEEILSKGISDFAKTIQVEVR